MHICILDQHPAAVHNRPHNTHMKCTAPCHGDPVADGQRLSQPLRLVPAAYIILSPLHASSTTTTPQPAARTVQSLQQQHCQCACAIITTIVLPDGCMHCCRHDSLHPSPYIPQHQHLDGVLPPCTPYIARHSPWPEDMSQMFLEEESVSISPAVDNAGLHLDLSA